MFRPAFLALGTVIGLLSSVIPYWLELEALRRIPARVFGVWMSMQPAVAALIGLAVLGQRLSVAAWAGICCVVAASAGAARSAAQDLPAGTQAPGVVTAVDALTGGSVTGGSVTGGSVTVAADGGVKER
jgi:multidrug transporter EmrE-like cation transporter